MFEIKKRKLQIFKRILKNIDGQIKISTEMEIKLVSLCFELSFNSFLKYMKIELRNNYVKKRKTIEQKGSNRLQNITE